MADRLPEQLRLRDAFPGTASDPDPEGKLAWETGEGVNLRAWYRTEQPGDAPGEFPFVRGGGPEGEFPNEPVRADLLAERGATIVQQLAYGIAEGVERLAAGTDPRGIGFVWSSGPLFLLEVAKLRAARWMWATAVQAFGTADEDACRMRMRVRTPLWNKSRMDAYNNLLRCTAEAAAALIGGADTVEIRAFGFDPQLAENALHILREEAGLHRVADPAGGSFYVEAATRELAEAAWKLFQQVERNGGFERNREAMDVAVEEARKQRERAFAAKQTVLVGVNRYPGELMGAPDDNGEWRLAALAEQGA